jgi:hypothetical protein
MFHILILISLGFAFPPLSRQEELDQLTGDIDGGGLEGAEITHDPMQPNSDLKSKPNDSFGHKLLKSMLSIVVQTQRC